MRYTSALDLCILVYYIFMFMLLLHLLFNVVYHGIGHGFAHVHFYPNKDRSIVMLTSSIRLCYFLHFKAPNGFSLLADSFL
jgi:hypothetical protein